MDIVTPVVVGALLALFTAIQAWINQGRFAALNQRIDSLDRRMDGFEQRLEVLDSKIDRRFEQVMAEIAQVRSDLLQVVLALKPSQETA